MKFAVTAYLVLATCAAALGPAQARLTPFDGTREAKEADLVALYRGPAAAELEDNYFKAPPAEVSQRRGRCTVRTFVFDKSRLAEACY